MTHWIALYVKNNEVIYFDSFCVEHVPTEIKRVGWEAPGNHWHGMASCK